MPFGSFVGLLAVRATSPMVMVWLDFGDENMPSSNLMSSTPTLSTCAAIFLPFSITLSAAAATAEPPSVAEREPPVPSP